MHLYGEVMVNGFASLFGLCSNILLDRSDDDQLGFTYVQGMNVLAAPFLYTMPSEIEAFFCFAKFIEEACPLYVQPTLEGVHRGLKVRPAGGINSHNFSENFSSWIGVWNTWIPNCIVICVRKSFRLKFTLSLVCPYSHHNIDHAQLSL